MESLVDKIYEAAIVPQHWTAVLDGMAQMSGGVGTLLFADTRSNMQLICSPSIQDFCDQWVNSRWLEHNTRGQRLIPIREPRFLTDLDGFSPEELDREPFYTEFLRSWGLGWCVGTAIRSPPGDTLVFSVEREHHKGPVERHQAEALDGLRPHLARSALLSARMGLERARAGVEVLQAVGLPAAVLTSNGRALVFNEKLASLSPTIRIGARDKVSFGRSESTAIFESILPTLRDPKAGGRSLPLPAESGSPPIIVHFLPIRRSALDIFSGAYALMYVTELAIKAGPQPALLEALFDLTAAEAKVASQLVEGQSVSEIALRQGVASNTVRMQLKSIFAKTGVHRQAELVGLLTIRP